MERVGRDAVKAHPSPANDTCRRERPLGYSRLGLIVKRATDVVGAVLGLGLGLPLLLVAAILISLETEGPIIFKQSRVGQFGRPFTLYKLRGMYGDAAQRFPHLYQYCYRPDQVAGLKFHPDKDPRVTRVGGFLRSTSIDELPNLWNVLRGDMSLVGPRPEIPEMLPYYGAAANVILSIKPGVTSLAKVNGRDQLTFAETLEYDLDYVLTRSTWLDTKILLRTASTLLRDGWVTK